MSKNKDLPASEIKKLKQTIKELKAENRKLLKLLKKYETEERKKEMNKTIKKKSVKIKLTKEQKREETIKKFQNLMKGKKK